MEKPTVRTDVLVIGAGVIGAATAYELAKRGLKVTVVDAGAGIGNGCSYANAGLLAPSHVEPLTTPANIRMGIKYLFRRDSPFHISPSAKIAPWLAEFAFSSTPKRAAELTAAMQSLARRSLDLHRSYAHAGLATGFRETGSMDVFMTQDGFAAAQTLADPDHGTIVLTADQARAIEPGLGDVAGAVQHTEDATCESQAFVGAALEAAAHLGAEVHWSTEVSRLLGGSGRVTGAQTTLGVVTADHVVLAAGLSSGRLVREHGIRLNLLGGKGYVLDVPAQVGPGMPLTFKELRVVATPYGDRLRFCGTMDLGDTTDTIVESRVDAIRRAAFAGLPAVDTSKRIQTWTGQRPCTADGIPVIGPSSGVSNLHLGTGHGMWGVVLAPITAELIADGVVGLSPDPAGAPFSPSRFEGPGPRVLRGSRATQPASTSR